MENRNVIHSSRICVLEKTQLQERKVKPRQKKITAAGQSLIAISVIIAPRLFPRRFTRMWKSNRVNYYHYYYTTTTTRDRYLNNQLLPDK